MCVGKWRRLYLGAIGDQNDLSAKSPCEGALPHTRNETPTQSRQVLRLTPVVKMLSRDPIRRGQRERSLQITSRLVCTHVSLNVSFVCKYSVQKTWFLLPRKQLPHPSYSRLNPLVGYKCLYNFFFFYINKESGPNTWNTFCYLLYNLKPEPLMPCQDKPQRRKAPSVWKELWHLSEPRGKLQHRLSTGKEASGPSGDEDALRSRYRNITSDSAQGAGVTSFKTQFPECMW